MYPLLLTDAFLKKNFVNLPLSCTSWPELFCLKMFVIQCKSKVNNNTRFRSKMSVLIHNSTLTKSLHGYKQPIHFKLTNHLRAPYGVYFKRLILHLKKSYDSRAPGRRQEQSNDKKVILAIVRCPVKLRYYQKFHGARTVFGCCVGSMRVKLTRPANVRCPDGARSEFPHIGRAPDDLFKF